MNKTNDSQTNDRITAESISLEDPKVAEFITRYQNALSAGRSPDRTEFLNQFPEIEDELNECLDGLEFLHRASVNFEHLPDASSSRVSSRTALGDFKLLRELGHGGMGVVYEAVQMSLERRVAIKILPFAALLDARQLQRFKNEARAAAMLKHPNIVSVYQVGNDRGVHFYAMEFIEGCTLAEIIHSDSASPDVAVKSASDPQTCPDTIPIAALSTIDDWNKGSSFKQITRVGIETAEALHFAHQEGVIHRDIKPSNLLMDQDGHVHVTDFGLARVQANDGLTMTGELVGTLRYMSPEQTTGEHGIVDHRTDLYSLGVTIYELLTGQPAVRGTDRVELLRNMDRDLIEPIKINPKIPRDLNNIIVKATAKRPVDRYDSAIDLRDDLQRFLEQRPVRARRISRLSHFYRWVQRHKAIAALLTILLLVLVFLSVAGPWIAFQQQRLVHKTQRMNSNLALSAAWNAWHNGDIQSAEAHLAQLSNHSALRQSDFPHEHLWNRLQSLQRVPSLEHLSPVHDLTFSPDGQQIITATQKGILRVWDPVQLSLIRAFDTKLGSITSISTSKSGNQIAIGCQRTNRVVVYDLTDESSTQIPQPDRVMDVAFLDERNLCIATDDCQIAIWDVEDSTSPTKTLIDAHKLGMQRIAVSTDRKQLASAGYDGLVKVWTLPEFKHVVTLENEFTFNFQSLRYSPDGRWLATAARDVSIWDTSNWKRACRFGQSKRDISSIAFTNDSRFVLAPSLGMLAIWDIESERQVGDLGQVGDVFALAPKNDQIAKAIGRTVHINPFSVPQRQYRQSSTNVKVRLTALGKKTLLLVGTGEVASIEGYGSVAIYDANSLELRNIRRDLPPIFAMEPSSKDPSLFAIGGGERRTSDSPSQVRLWDAQKNVPICSLLGSPGVVLNVAFSPDGQFLATSLVPNLQIDDGVIDLWNVEDRKLLKTYSGFAAWGLRFSPDGESLAASGIAKNGGEIRIFDVESEEIFETITTYGLSPALEWHPNDNELVVSRSDKGIQILVTQDFNQSRQAKSRIYQCFDICFSPDEEMIIAGGREGLVKIWDAETGDDRATLKASGSVTSVCFSEDGELLVAGCSNRTVTLWRRDGRRDVIRLE